MKKQLTFGITLMVILGIFVTFFGGCKKEELATLTTQSVSEITTNSGLSGGNITSDGGGETTSRGVVWATHESPSIEQHLGVTTYGGGSGLFTSNITNLSPGTTYYVRAFAVNGAGTAYGNQITFSTTNPPVANFVASHTSGPAPLTVSFTDQSTNNPTSWSWNFGDGTSSTQQHPSHTYNTPGNYTVQLTVSNAHGSHAETKTAYIQVSERQDGITGTFTDTRDGQTYKWIRIGASEKTGNQVWMAQNLNYDSPGSRCYDDDVANCNHYGRLYTWDNAMAGASSSSANPSGVQGVCPVGWHVPSDDEWEQLITFVISQGHLNEWNDPNGAANALKSCRQVNSPLAGQCNTSDHPRWSSNATHHGIDAFNFSALPGGVLTIMGNFSNIGNYGIWWAATEGPVVNGVSMRRISDNGNVMSGNNFHKAQGFSLRCVRD